jgi:DNA processing protein
MASTDRHQGNPDPAPPDRPRPASGPAAASAITASAITSSALPASALPASALPAEAWVTALASLDQMGPARLRALLAERPPAQAWQRVAAGGLGRRSGVLARALGGDAAAITGRWRQQAATIDVAAMWAAHRAAGIGVVIRSSAGFPAVLADDPEPPSILFTAGDPDVLAGARVAVVGTRDCSRYGYDVARRLGAELAASGVSVVSGLALGIDGAAHVGALDAAGAPPIAVVGSGLDRLYPARNASLWRRVAAAGVVLSEYPLGTPPLAWHFPTRNRLIVALADVVVVVESQERGGSMLTVDCAIERDVEVMAVPGPVTSPTSAGTNRLLSEGRAVVRDATDVLVALGLGAAARRSAVDRRPLPAPGDRPVIDAFDWQPATLDQLVLRSGIPLGELAPALHRLVEAGWVEQRGGWFERIAQEAG